MHRAVEAPDQVWSSADQSAAWLGISVTEFRHEVAAFPHLLPHRKFGKAHRWHWLDLVAYVRVRERLDLPVQKRSSDPE